MFGSVRVKAVGLLAVALLFGPAVSVAEDWRQLKYDCRHSGNVPERSVTTPLGLVGAVALSDAVFTAPVVADGRVYVVDGSGVAFCLDAATLRVIWRVATPVAGRASLSLARKANCNNVSSPALADGYLHFGTMAGSYYVLSAADGRVVKEIACGEPIFSTPVVGNEQRDHRSASATTPGERCPVGDRVYFATLGSQVYALKPDGTVCWTWDYVKQRLGFSGDRFSAQDWLRHKKGRVTWRDQFCCSRDLAMYGKTLVVPAGGETVFLDDAGGGAELRAVGLVPSYKGSEAPATFGQSIGETGAVYRQWHRRDNTGRVEILRLVDGKVKTDFVPGTLARDDMAPSLSFSSVSLRGEDVFRCRPEENFGLCRHCAGQEEPQRLGGYPSISSPILLREQAVYGGLDGRLYVVPLAGGQPWSFETAFGKAISAPVAVCDGRIYFGCEDGYLYVLGPEGKAPPTNASRRCPSKDLGLWKIRSPLGGERSDPKYDWFSNFGDLANTNANDQGIAPPLVIKWIRRYEGTFKHLPVCGGGRMYTHTAEGQIFAVEQETGRLLWRRYWPGVHVCFTSPLYWNERLLVPQAGLEQSRMRCLDAATGKLLWEAPFTGSPSWSRAQPPVVHKKLAIYMFGTGRYVPEGSGIYVMRMGTTKALPTDTAGTVSWLYSHDNPFYPEDHRALVRAWDMETGKEVWEKDFSEYGSGGDDAGLCLMDGKLYYSCFFGYAAKRRGAAGPTGLTAAMDPATGRVLWLTTKYSVTAGCTISGRDGRLYLGGYNQPQEKTSDRYVWCLDAKDGSLIWQSDPLVKAINVVTVGGKFVFAFAYGGESYLIDKETGKIVSTFNKGYACTRFTVSGPYIMGANADMIDTSQDNAVVSSGPPVDTRECVGTVVSNGRLFYTAQASGLQMCQVCGGEAASFTAPWRRGAAR
jgi:outer membrane protein assembly factor BamB